MSARQMNRRDLKTAFDPLIVRPVVVVGDRSVGDASIVQTTIIAVNP